MHKRIRVLLDTGFFHIFGAGTINKVVSALMSIVVVRILSKEDYGMYAYVYNLVSFFILFNGLGAASAFLQLGCEAKTDKEIVSILRYSSRVGVSFDVVLAFFVLLASFLPMSFSECPSLLRLYALYPLVILIFDILMTLFRIKLDNKKYALFTNIQTILLAVLSIVGAYCGQVVGLIIGQYVAYVLSGCLAWLASVKLVRDARGGGLPDFDRRAYWVLSVTSSINNGLGSALTLVGVFIIGLLTGDELAVAGYKVATTIPFALLFIPGAVITYIYPFFVKNKEDARWSLSKYLQLMAVGAVVYGAIVSICCVFGSSIITLVFGAQYESVTSAFQIIMIGFFVTATLRQPTGNLLVTQKKLWFNTLTGVLCLTVCCALCVFLVPGYGIDGAAWAYTLSMLSGALCNVPYYIFVLVKQGRRVSPGKFFVGDVDKDGD